MCFLTGDTAEQTQSGGASSETIEDWVRVAFGDRDGHGDGFVKLPPSGLQGDNGAEGGLVPQDFPHYIYTHWLSL